MELLYTDLEDEVRDGFYVDSLMKCCQMEQLQVLEEIDRICQKYNIQYQAEWGTLLGTIRHNGFIPWDDDMDISMKREDYNKFLQVAEKELPEKYHILNYRNDEEYWDVMSRVVNSQNISFDSDYLDKHSYFPFCTGIDIFPLDYMPANEEEAKILRELVEAVKNVADAYGAGVLEGELLERELQELEYYCNMKISREGNLKENLYHILVSLYSLYREEESEKVVAMPLWVESGNEAFLYPKEYYAKTIRLPFDKIKIPVPIAYDSILKQKYGDYMKMVRKGGTHDYPYFKEQIEIVENMGIVWPRFQYSDRVCREEGRGKSRKVSLNVEDISILENVHISFYKLLALQDRETAIQLMVRCQQCAVQIGETIEKTIANNENLITLLEEYCELVFQIYELLQSGENLNPEAVFQLLQEQYLIIKKEYSKEYELKKKIVFITDKVSRWKSLESIWRAAKEDKNSIVSVIVVPYAYKRVDGSVLEEHYEKDLFPDYVEVEDFSNFNLQIYHPDVIYINTPYDEYNYFTTIHPYFYSSNLVNMCEKLVYIPWFVLTELTREDERGWQSMQHFVTKPGVVNADKVIVQSEQMKEAYVEYLTDWAGEETRSIWEEKICGLGSPLLDKEDNRDEIEKRIPENWKKYLYKANGERKKVILYNIPAGSFIDYKEKAIDKLQRVLEIFKENKDDICLFWYWDKSLESTLKEDYIHLWSQFLKIVEQYQEEAWGIYEEDVDKDLIVSLSDAYYGDGSVISQVMVMAEKPVMLQNYDC